MRKLFRYFFQYALLIACGYFIYQTAFRREAPPVHDRAAWTQRDGFVALSYGGVTIDERVHSLVTKDRLREQLATLAKAGYQTVTTADLVDFYTKNKPLPEKALYLMFEGGRKDSVLFSQPVLTGIGFNATLYLYGDHLTGWNRFFVRQNELRKIADNPFWEVGSMGFHSGLINQTPAGGYAYYLTERLKGVDGRPEETQEAFDARVVEDFAKARTSIENLGKVTPLGYAFMPANTLGVSLPEALARPNAEALAAGFPLAFTRIGETYNSRDVDPRRLARLQVGPDWSADRLLLEIESRQPRSRYMDFTQTVRQGLWQTTLGDLTALGDTLALTPPAGKDAFARLRGTESFENFTVTLKAMPPEGDGAALVYLRYRDFESFLRIRVTSQRVTVQEKTGPSLNTIFQYALPLDHVGSVGLDACVKGNRLLLTVDGKSVANYPIPLTAETRRGSLALGAADEGVANPRAAGFSEMRLSAFPPHWISAKAITDVPLGDARTLTAVVLPADSLEADPLRDAAALVTAAASGVEVHLDLSGQDPAVVEQALARVADAPAGLIFSRLLRGFVLTLGQPEDLDRLVQAAAKLKAKGYAVTLRVEAAAVSRLLEADFRLAPDWLLFDMPPPADDAAVTALENRFDRSRMLYRAASQAGNTTVSYEVKG